MVLSSSTPRVLYVQYDVRAIGALTSNNVQTSKFYLVGFNDQQANVKLGMNPVEYNGHPNSVTLPSEDYLAWIKQQVRKVASWNTTCSPTSYPSERIAALPRVYLCTPGSKSCADLI